MTFEEQVSFTDNSHLVGVPFVVKEETHCYAKMHRRDVRAFLEGTSRRLGPVELHVVYEEEV